DGIISDDPVQGLEQRHLLGKPFDDGLDHDVRRRQLLDVGAEGDAAEDLLDLLVGRAGQTVTLRIARGGTGQDVAVLVGERPDSGA
ncbi:MAG TPA: hypothetical protein VH138_04615, partial [Vicinamibacterales bacterium]|nr:hypothetical protein [Vicinamibacterales bacterium]